MSSRNHPNYDPFDVFIGRCLKNWLGQMTPPANARERLLYTASINSLEKTYFQQVLRPFLRNLTVRMAGAFALNHKEHIKHPMLVQNSLFINANIHNSVAYQTMIRSIPTGGGLLCYLY